ALHASLFSFGSLVSFVARIQETFENILRFGYGISINGARLDDLYRLALNRARDPDLVAAFRQDNVIEAAAGDQRASGRNAEAHRQRNRFLITIMRGDYLPH